MSGSVCAEPVGGRDARSLPHYGAELWWSTYGHRWAYVAHLDDNLALVTEANTGREHVVAYGKRVCGFQRVACFDCPDDPATSYDPTCWAAHLVKDYLRARRRRPQCWRALSIAEPMLRIAEEELRDGNLDYAARWAERAARWVNQAPHTPARAAMALRCRQVLQSPAMLLRSKREKAIDDLLEFLR